MPTLIFVHGRGRQDPPDALHETVAGALQVGLQRAGVQDCPPVSAEALHLAYWSDLFHLPLTEGATEEQEHPAHTELLGRLLDHYWSIGRHRLAAPPAARGPTPASVVSTQAAQLSAELPAATEAEQKHEDTFVRDIIKYFYLGYAQRVQEPLVKLLVDLPLEDGLLILSHSLGVVITYDVILRRFEDIARARAAAGKPPLLVDSWVTLGSPLGWAIELEENFPQWAREAAIDLVVDRAAAGIAAPVMLPTTFPAAGIKRWYNLFDPQDPISYPPLVRLFRNDTLTVSTTFLDQGVERVLDIRIRNELAQVDPGPLGIERHNKIGYLHSAQFGLLLHDFALRWSQGRTPTLVSR